jgi:transcriptional regulator with XRE-family HTH domain
MNESVGSRIKAVRKSLNLTQEEFVLPLEITQTHLSSIEKGRYNASMHLLKLMCLTYPVRFDWLTTGEGDMQPDAADPAGHAVSRREALTPAQLKAVDNANMAHLAATEAENAFLNSVQLTDAQLDLFRACLSQAREAQDELQRAIRKGVNPYTVR